MPDVNRGAIVERLLAVRNNAVANCDLRLAREATLELARYGYVEDGYVETGSAPSIETAMAPSIENASQKRPRGRPRKNP